MSSRGLGADSGAGPPCYGGTGLALERFAVGEPRFDRGQDGEAELPADLAPFVGRQCAGDRVQVVAQVVPFVSGVLAVVECLA